MVEPQPVCVGYDETALYITYFMTDFKFISGKVNFVFNRFSGHWVVNVVDGSLFVHLTLCATQYSDPLSLGR